MTDAPTPPENPPGGTPDQPPAYPTAPPAYPAAPPSTQSPAPAFNPSTYASPGSDDGQSGGSMYGGALPAPTFANWGQRVGAYFIDALAAIPFMIIGLVGVVIVISAARTTTDAYGNTVATSMNQGPATIGFILIALGYLAVLVFSIWNVIFRQGRTGWSIGKKVMGIRLVNMHTGQPIGAGLCFVRQIAHILDGLLCYVGYLWPIWDPKRQTFADKIMSTVVIPATEPKK